MKATHLLFCLVSTLACPVASASADMFQDSINAFLEDENNAEISRKFDQKHGKGAFREALRDMMVNQGQNTDKIPEAGSAFSALTLFDVQVRNQAIKVYQSKCKGELSAWPCEALSILRKKADLAKRCEDKDGNACLERARTAEEAGFQKEANQLIGKACDSGNKRSCELIQQDNVRAAEERRMHHERNIAEENRQQAEAASRRAQWDALLIQNQNKRSECVSERLYNGKVRTRCN